MYEENKFNSPLVKLSRVSPLVWGFILVIIAGLLAMIPFFQSFFRTLALLPLLVGGLLLYQAIWKNKY
jgi:hypothetical protein